jgi:hypothetical protein
MAVEVIEHDGEYRVRVEDYETPPIVSRDEAIRFARSMAGCDDEPIIQEDTDEG